jgi:hypothetical protein
VTTQTAPIPQIRDAATDPLSPLSQRLLALSGLAFAPLFVVGLFISGGRTPHYTAGDQAWTNWAHDNQWKGRIGAFALLLAAFLFLYFIVAIRSVLERAESELRGSAQLAGVAFAGALTGIVGMTMAFVSIAAASSEGANANPVVSRAVTTATTGPFLVAAIGFAAFLIAVGVLTLRSGVFSRWSGIVALVGAVSFLVTSLTVIDGTGDGNVLGYAFFPAILSLATWTVATSVASRAD